MSVRRSLLVLWLILLVPALPAEAQERTAPAQVPWRGVVWDVPADAVQAAADLRRFERLGFTAVRTGLIEDSTLLILADTLGLQLFQELPLDDLPATRLEAYRATAQAQLAEALRRAAAHPSARHFGLARRADTSDPRACAFFETLARQADALAGAEVYYVSRFADADRCDDAVDFVLLDLRDAPDPPAALRRWEAASSVPAGVAALGTWVGARAGTGLHHRHSAEAQARYLETHLRTLLADTAAVPAIFVYRWRDVELPAPTPAADLARPYAPGYGLLAADGTPRPALGVVEGFFAGTQTIFAFPAGEAPRAEVPWPVIYGWIVFAIVAACFALSSRFRYMVLRYFQAYGFYRDALREGRDVMLGASAALLVALSLAVGVLGSVVLEALRTTPAFEVLFGTLPLPMQDAGVVLLGKPWLLVLLLSSIYALSVALWSSLLALASRRRQPLSPGQTMMLVVWRRWLFLIVLAGAMTVPSLPPSLARRVVLVLVGVWVLAATYAIVRTTIDYAAITNVPGYVVVLIGLFNPLVLLVVAGFALSGFSLEMGPAIGYALHLILRS